MIERDSYYAKVVKCIDSKEIIINKGTNKGIKIGQEFLIYTIGEELFDPDTGDSLGNTEIVKGRGEVKHVQPKQATLISNYYEKPLEITIKSNPYSFVSILQPPITSTKTLKSFSNIHVNDLVKPI